LHEASFARDRWHEALEQQENNPGLTKSANVGGELRAYCSSSIN
jgi:hypothetical protein